MGMKKMTGLILSALVLMFFGASVVTSQGAWAACGGSFLGFRAWHEGLLDEKTCELKPLKKDRNLTGDVLAKYVWTIILNLMSTMFSMIGFVMIGVFAYGGIKQITSRGEPNAVVAGKKAMANGIVGLIIMLLATVIVNTIIGVLVVKK